MKNLLLWLFGPVNLWLESLVVLYFSNPFDTPDTPEAPDYLALAEQQHQDDIEMYQMGLQDMRPDINIEGYGSQTWYTDPETGKSTVTMTHDPRTLELLGKETNLSSGAMQRLLGMMKGGKLGGPKLKNKDLNALPGMGSLMFSDPMAYQTEAYRRMKELNAPYEQQAAEARRTEVANAGGTGQEMDFASQRQFDDNQHRQDLMFMNDASSQAQDIFNMDLGQANFQNSKRGQAFNELLQKLGYKGDRVQRKFNELGSLTNFASSHDAPMSFPTFGIPGTPAAPDLVGAAGKQFQTDSTIYNQEVEQTNQSRDAIVQTMAALGL